MEDHSLCRAIVRNDTAAVQEALHNGAYVNCKWWNGNSTPLMQACQCANEEIVRILLDAGANVYWRNDFEFSPLLGAGRNGRWSVVELLLNHDKDLLEIADRNGYTPLLYATSGQHFKMVRFLLDRGANVHATDHKGTTALMHACQSDNLNIVQLFLAAGVDLEARDRRQETALHHAARYGMTDIVRELVLEHNANLFEVDCKGNTTFDLLLIIQRPDSPAVDQFLDIYTNKMTQEHGLIAIHAILGAAEYTFVENAGFHPPLKPSLQLRLPLGKVTLNHFRTLLSTLDTEIIRNRDENGKLPIHIAIQSNAPVEVLSMLVEIDPATLHIADHAGALPVHECCCDVVNYSSVRFIVEQGGVGTLAARTREGALPLHIFCESKNPLLRTVQYMVQSFPGAVTARTNAGQYPFVIAACESSTASLSVVYELVRANPDLVIPNGP